METKKTKRANLEKSFLPHILIGIVVALAGIFVLLEWKSQTKERVLSSDTDLFLFDAMDELSFISFDPPPPPPPPAQNLSVRKMLEDQLEKELFVSTGDGLGEPLSLSFLPVILPDEEEEYLIESIEDIGADVYLYPIVEIEDDIHVDPGDPVPSYLAIFPGGEAEMYNYLSKSIQYPTLAIERGIEGEVICSFVVNKEGQVVDVKAVFSPDPLLSKEAVRVISAMPGWQPGVQRRKPVHIRYTIPVHFQIPK